EKLPYTYIPETLVKMRTGGSSTQGIKSTLTINKEMLRSCKMHGINTHYGKIYSKYFTKVFQLLKKPL
ncbi:MAG: glycosyltransferase, partial [Bacteroidota bacterium]